MKRVGAVFVFVCAHLLWTAALFPQTDYRGLPWISNYSPDDYGAATQNWAATQDGRGLIYIANNEGVLEFDGLEWRLLRIGQNQYPRSLAVAADQRVYVGSMGDFGCLVPAGNGSLTYQSLAQGLALNADSIGDVITTVTCGDAVIFVSSDGIFLCRQNKVLTIRPETKFHLGFSVAGQFYTRQRGRGLYRLVGASLVFVPGSERFAEDRVYMMFPEKDDTILIGARDAGILLFDPGAPLRSAFRPAAQFDDFAKVLVGKKVTVCDRLPDGSIALATIQSGLYLVSAQGQVIFHVDKAKGLLNDCVYYVCADSLGNLVLCLSVGVSYVESGTPFTFLNEKLAINGMGNALFRQVPATGRGRLYLGTYQGVFFRNDGAEEEAYRLIPQSTETWCFALAQGQLLCGHNAGISQLVNGRLQPIVSDHIVLSLLFIRERSDYLLAGAFDGLLLLHHDGKRWQYSGQVNGFSQSAFGLTRTLDNDFWLFTNTGNGLFRLTLSDDLRKVVRQVQYTKKDGLPADTGNVIYGGRHRFYVGTGNGLYRFAAQGQRFEPDPDFPALRGMDLNRTLLYEADNGDVWIAGDSLNCVFRRQQDGSYRLEKGLINRLGHFRLGEFMTVLDERNVFFGYQDGFIHFDPSRARRTFSPFRVLLRRVDAPYVELFGGTFFDSRQRPLLTQRPDSAPVLPYRRNNLRFIFAAPFFEGSEQTEYSYQLAGFDRIWSEWNRQGRSSYTNLPEGTYTFQVKARNVYGEISAPASFRITIQSPWYRTIPAYLAYLLLAVSLVMVIVKFYSRHLLREKIRLEGLVAEKTQELKEASLRDPLTGLRNRRFITEIVEPELRAFLSFKKYLLDGKDKRVSDAAPKVFAIFMFDLDHFKAVNDAHGHEAGDRLLRQFANILRQAIREDDFCIRWGGEEFLVILKKTSLNYVDIFARKIKEKVAETQFVIAADGRKVLRKTCSIGYTVFPFYEEAPELVSYEQVIQLADLGLYYSKQHGRNLAVRVEPGQAIPRGEQLLDLLTALDFGLAKGFLKIST